MKEIKSHEYELLNEIAQDSLVTQSSLSQQLGIAVGSVNWYIKRLINRGWIKVSRLDRTRLKYDLTSEGMRVFSQRAMQYMKSSLGIYRELREEASQVISELKEQDISSVCLDGDDERIDIFRLTCLEQGMLVDDHATVCIKAKGQSFQIEAMKQKG